MAWRAARLGRDPLIAAPSQSRWGNGGFDVLYCALERDGAVAEIHALLRLQPVFPSRMDWAVHELAVTAERVLRLPDLADLAPLGVDVARYGSREHAATQAVADAAVFLGFDALIAPGARWPCLNMMLFGGAARVLGSEGIDWGAWRGRLD